MISGSTREMDFAGLEKRRENGELGMARRMLTWNRDGVTFSPPD
jgi:hypothetical protein